MKKAHKGQRFPKGEVVQEAITSWLHQKPHDFNKRGIDGLMKLRCLSQQPWGMCQIT